MPPKRIVRKKSILSNKKNAKRTIGYQNGSKDNTYTQLRQNTHTRYRIKKSVNNRKNWELKQKQKIIDVLQSENDKLTQEKETLLIKISHLQYHIEQNYIYHEQQSQPSQQNKSINVVNIYNQKPLRHSSRLKNQKQKEQKKAAEILPTKNQRSYKGNQTKWNEEYLPPKRCNRMDLIILFELQQYIPYRRVDRTIKICQELSAEFKLPSIP
eukprot:6646_1